MMEWLKTQWQVWGWTKTLLAWVLEFLFGFGGTYFLCLFFLSPENRWLESSNHYMMVFHAAHNELLITMAAAIVGIIAITFSLAIFSIQHAAEKGTTAILREYRHDKTYRWTFILLCIFSLLVFLFAVLPAFSYFTFISYIMAFAFLVTTFYLLWRIFIHTVELVNPIERIQKIFNRSSKYLKDLSTNIEKAIDDGNITLDLDEDNKLDSQKKRAMMISGTFQKAPSILNPVRADIAQVFDIVREYIPRRKYDVTIAGFTAIAYTVARYFQARKNSMDTSQMFIALSRSNGFLVDIYEQLAALNRISIGDRDLATTQQNLRCFQVIVIQAINYPSLTQQGESSTINMALGYLKGNAQDAIRAGLDDAGLDAIRILRDIDTTLPKEMYLATQTIIDDIYQLALTGIVSHKFYIVDEAVSAIVQIYNRRVKPYESSVSRRLIFDKLKAISKFYLEAGFNISVNCEGLSAAFSILNDNSLPRAFINSMLAITPENFDDDGVMDLFHFYRDVGQKAAETDSFLLHFIVQSIENIVMAAMNIFGEKEDKDKYEDILDEFIWLLSVYWYSYEKQPNNNRSNHIELTGIDNLTAIALRAIELGYYKFAKRVIGQISSVISTSLKKEVNEYRIPRMLVHLAKVGTFARVKGVKELEAEAFAEIISLNTRFLEQAQKEVEKEYFDKRYKEALHKELWEMYLDFDKRDHITAFDSDILFREAVDLKDIKEFLNTIEKFVYNREITDMHRRPAF